MAIHDADLDLDYAVPGTLAITPTEAMMDASLRDYGAMFGMIFGDVPVFGAVTADVAEV